MDDTDNDKDERSDEGNAKGKGRRRDGGEGEMAATRCRHVAEERDGACLFKPILYRIFILMDFFNSESWHCALRVFVLWLWPGKRTRNAMIPARSDDELSPLPPDYHIRVSITVRISTARNGPSSRRVLSISQLGLACSREINGRSTRCPDLSVHFP
jgi:hypothetical protein